MQATALPVCRVSGPTNDEVHVINESLQASPLASREKQFSPISFLSENHERF